MVGLSIIFLMVIAMVSDLARYRIPNTLVLALLALYPVAVLQAPQPVDWPMALAGMLAVLVVGYFIFAMKWMGGGDIKLLAALALWVGWAGLLDYVFLVAMLGGVFAVAVWCVRRIIPLVVRPSRALPRMLQQDAPIAYGVAIAGAFLILMWQGKVIGV